MGRKGGKVQKEETSGTEMGTRARLKSAAVGEGETGCVPVGEARSSRFLRQVIVILPQGWGLE